MSLGHNQNMSFGLRVNILEGNVGVILPDHSAWIGGEFAKKAIIHGLKFTPETANPAIPRKSRCSANRAAGLVALLQAHKM
jgi:hypothetical protein